METELKKALALKETNIQAAIANLGNIVKASQNAADNDPESIKYTEQAILELGGLLAQTENSDELGGLIKFTRPFLAKIGKAKAARLVRQLLDNYLDIEDTGKKQTDKVQVCLECIDWAKTEKRTFLRQALEARLIALYFDTEKYTEALALGVGLLKELKKLDDKALLVEVQLLESKCYNALGNLTKAKAALTSARTTANGIYCPPKQQASLDLMSGILHAAEDRDFKTAYSYFYEAFEGYDSIDNPKAITALKYMLLCKIMLNNAEEVNTIVSGKLALKYSGPATEAMKSIAAACHERSLANFKVTLQKHEDQLVNDPVINSHLETFNQNLLELNLCRIIEPFSRVQIDHIAKIINLPLETVEKKLSQMILDKKFNGILDQGSGVLVVYDEVPTDKTYESTLKTIQDMNSVVDILYKKTKKLT